MTLTYSVQDSSLSMELLPSRVHLLLLEDPVLFSHRTHLFELRTDPMWSFGPATTGTVHVMYPIRVIALMLHLLP